MIKFCKIEVTDWWKYFRWMNMYMICFGFEICYEHFLTFIRILNSYLFIWTYFLGAASKNGMAFIFINIIYLEIYSSRQNFIFPYIWQVSCNLPVSDSKSGKPPKSAKKELQRGRSPLSRPYSSSWQISLENWWTPPLRLFCTTTAAWHGPRRPSTSPTAASTSSSSPSTNRLERRFFCR